MRRGFTILELGCVIAIIALLAALSIPLYETLVFRAQAAEASAMPRAIAHAELRHFRDRGVFLACDPGGEVPRGAGTFPNAAPCWRELGIGLHGQVRYRYAVALWHLQTAAEVRTVAEALHRDATWGRPLEGEPLAWTRDGCTVRYRLDAGTLRREGEGDCAGSQALATGVSALLAETGGVVLEKSLPLRPGLTQHDRVFIPLGAP